MAKSGKSPKPIVPDYWSGKGRYCKAGMRKIEKEAKASLSPVSR